MKTEEKEIQCLNCGHIYEGQFCPHCGQKAKTKRLQFVEMFRNFIGAFVGGDNKFLNTCRDLIMRPGYMVRNYLLGRRIRYYHPLQMYVYAITTYAIVSYVLGVSSSIFDDMADLEFEPSEKAQKYASIGFVMSLANALYTNKLYGTLFLSFVATFPYRMLFRTKLERQDGAMLPLNLTEQFYTKMYHSCLQVIVSILLLPVCLINGTDDIVLQIYAFASVLYAVVMYKQLLGIGWMKSILLNGLAAILTILLVVVLLVLVISAGLIIERALK